MPPRIQPKIHNRLRNVGFLIAIAGLALGAGPAAAQNYPWCANFADGAGTNCGFTSEQQCRVTIAGSGGYCSQNNQYVPAASAQPRAAKHHAASPAGKN
jgi:hypothetical protein